MIKIIIAGNVGLLHPFRRFISHSLWALISLLFTLLIILGILYAYMEFRLPDVTVLKDIHMQVPLRIYSHDKRLIAEYGAKRRVPVTIQQVPKQLVQAILATEDARFYSHPGVDFVGLVRAVVAVVSSGRKVQGASTITMQVARNFFLTREKTYSRKFQEILLALKIDQTLSKEKILELYVNKVYFGNRAYGVAAAALVYFGKSLDQLTLPEMAMIAGMPQAPTRNNPLKYPDNALKRRNHVLARMLEVGFIDKPTYEKAIHTPLTAKYHEEKVELDAPYMAEMVRQAVVEMYGDAAYEAGLKVVTTLTSADQRAAQAALQSGLIRYSQQHGLSKPNQAPPVQGAIVVLNPKNGAILALQGGYDYQTSSFNRVLQAQRQTGSNFKPFVYSAALAKGMTLATVINDAPIIIRDSGENRWWRPENDNLQFYGPTRLRVGLTKSRNLVSIRILQSMGIPDTLAYLERFGFKQALLPHSLSLALGSNVLTPLQVARGYAVFANGGYRITPYFIERIISQHKTLFEAHPEVACTAGCQPSDRAAPQVITPQNAYLMTQALRDVIQSGTARAAKVLNRSDLAGKTGTTNHQVDAWFTGFNGQLLTTVWVGFDDNERSLNAYGADVALPIWIQFMKTALANQPLSTMPEPTGIVTARIDPGNGLLAKPGQQNAIFELFEKGHTPVGASHSHVQAASSEKSDSGGSASAGAGAGGETSSDEHIF